MAGRMSQPRSMTGVGLGPTAAELRRLLKDVPDEAVVVTSTVKDRPFDATQWTFTVETLEEESNA